MGKRILKAVLFPIILGVLAFMSGGAACFPLLNPGDDPAGDTTPSNPLTVSVRFPSSDSTVPQGTVVRIDWTLFNETGSDALATVILRDREDLTNTVLVGGLRILNSGSQRTEFDTTDFGGRRFDLIIEVEAGSQQVSETAGGQITVNALPEFAFTEPFEPVVLGEDQPEPDPNSTEPPPDPTVTIRWTGGDAEGTGTVAIFGDTDLDHESGNEFEITSAALTTEVDFDSFEWDGVPDTGPVEEETVFNIYAEVSDDLNETFIVEGLATITVPEPEEEEEEEDDPVVFEFTDPNADADFLDADASTTLAFTLDEPNDVLVDLGVDLDDNHTSGNETLVLFQRLVSRKSNEESFEWDGTDTDGATVPNGIYRPYLVLNRGTGGNPIVIEADGLIFRRANASDPLIAIIDPVGEVVKDIGEFQTFRWRDDDPDEVSTIRIALDDDEFPNEAVETDNPEIVILPEREAAGDNVQDTFAYTVDVDPGTYFIFAYIDRDGVAPFDHISVAGGRLTVEDPDD